MSRKHKKKTQADFEAEARALREAIADDQRQLGFSGFENDPRFLEDDEEAWIEDAGGYNSYGSYNYDLNEEIYGENPFKRSGRKPESARELLEEAAGAAYEAKREARDSHWWDDWKSTGHWRGYSYFSQPTLDYRFVEQMANAFASQNNVDVRIGQEMGIDIEKKMLTYNPTALMFGTKANLIASLLHEIGHLRYTTPRTKLQSPFLAKYQDAAFEVINIFEDFRVDELMKKSYEGAPDVFDSQMPKVREMAQNFKKMGDKIVPVMMDQLKRKMTTIMQSFAAPGIDPSGNPVDMTARDQALIAEFGTADFAELAIKMKQMEEQLKDKVTFFDYCHAILLTGYGEQPKNLKGNLLDRINKTKPAIPKVIKAKEHPDALKILDSDVFPVIEDLLKEGQKGMKEVAQAFGAKAAQEAMQQAMQFLMNNTAEGKATVQGQTRQGKNGMQSRTSGHSDNQIPEKWAKGDYDAIKESVASAIRELIEKLTFLRRKEQTIRFQANQRRGKLNTKSLYRHRLNIPRLFKKKLETTDTIKSFAFSLIVDTSGSMEGDSIIHTTRGLVILAEVFNKMEIPFEIQTFNNDFEVVKAFDDELDQDSKKRIGGMVQSCDGGTNLYQIFGKHDKKILARPEKNKYAIILSDGGVSDGADYQKNFLAWRDKNLSVIGVGLNCGDEVVNLCMGNGFATEEPAEMPSLFAGLLKSLVDKKARN